MISWSSVEKSPESVGRRVQVYWPTDEAWFSGVIKSHRPEKGYHIKYDDGDEEWIRSLEGVKFPLNQNDEEEEDMEGNNTAESLEHFVKSSYEESIRKLNISECMGDAHWVSAKSTLLSLLSSDSVLSTSAQLSDKMQRIKYFIYKNLCHLEDREGQHPRQALSYGLLALQMSELPAKKTPPRRPCVSTFANHQPPLLIANNDTLLLARVAALAVQVGDLWTCHALLFSGLLQDSMDHVKLDLYEKWTAALTKSCNAMAPPPTLPPTRPQHVLTVLIAEDPAGDWAPLLMQLLAQLVALITALDTSTRGGAVCGGFSQESRLSVQDSVIINLKHHHNSQQSPYAEIAATPNKTCNNNKRALASVLSDAADDDADADAGRSCEMRGAKMLKAGGGYGEDKERDRDKEQQGGGELLGTTSSQESSSMTDDAHLSAFATATATATATETSSTVTAPIIGAANEEKVETVESAEATSTKRSTLPTTDRLTRRQRQDLLEKEKEKEQGNAGVTGASPANGQTYSIGSAEWEAQHRFLFEKHFATLRLLNTGWGAAEGGAAPAAVHAEDQVQRLLRALQSNEPYVHPTSEDSMSRNSLFPCAASVPTTLSLLNHSILVNQRRSVQQLVENTLDEDGGEVVDVISQSEPETVGSVENCGARRDAFISHVVVMGRDWLDFTSLLGSQFEKKKKMKRSSCGDVVGVAAVEELSEVKVAARIIDVFVAFLASMARTLKRMCGSAATQSITTSSASNITSQMELDSDDCSTDCLLTTSTKDSDHSHRMSTLRGAVLQTWQAVVNFHGGTEERLVSTLTEDEALMLGECMLHSLFMAPELGSTSTLHGEQESPYRADTCVRTLVLLLHRWEHVQCSALPVSTSLDSMVRMIRTLWLVHHICSLLRDDKRCPGWTSGEDEEDEGDVSVSPWEATDSPVLARLLCLIGDGEVCLPHLLDDASESSRACGGGGGGDGWSSQSRAADSIHVAAIADNTPLATINRHVISNLQNKTKSSFLLWLQSRGSLVGTAESSAARDALWQWLTRVRDFVALPMARALSANDHSSPPQYDVSSLYQPHLMSTANFMTITAPTCRLVAAAAAVDLSVSRSKQTRQQGKKVYKTHDPSKEVDDPNVEVHVDLMHVASRSRYSFLLVLLDTAVDCLEASGTATDSCSDDDVTERLTLIVQVLVLLLSSLETLERRKLLVEKFSVLSSRHAEAVRQLLAARTVEGVLSFAIGALSKLKTSVIDRVPCVPAPLLQGLEVLVSHWFLVVYSCSAVEAANVAPLLSLRGQVLGLSERLRACGILPSALSSELVDSGEWGIVSATTCLVYISCCHEDLCGTLAAHKGFRDSCSVASYRQDSLLRFLLSSEVILEERRITDSTAGRQAVFCDYAYHILSTFNDGCFLKIGGAIKVCLQTLLALPDGMALFADSGAQDRVYDSVKGAFAVSKVGRANQLALEAVADSSATAQVLGTTLFACIKTILVVMTDGVFSAIPSVSAESSDEPGEDAGADEEGVLIGAQVDTFVAYLSSARHLYETWISAKGLFFMDGGCLSLYLADRLMGVIKQDFRRVFLLTRRGKRGRTESSDEMDLATEGASCRGGGGGGGGASFMQQLPDEAITDLITLVGQIYFDVFRLPVGTMFISHKECSMQADICQLVRDDGGSREGCGARRGENELFESLFCFIRYCEDDLAGAGGLSKADLRASYCMLYQAFPLLRTPGLSGHSGLMQRERHLLHVLFATEATTSASRKLWSDFFTFTWASSESWHPDVYLGALLQSFYEKLGQYGLSDQETTVAVDVMEKGEDSIDPAGAQVASGGGGSGDECTAGEDAASVQGSSSTTWPVVPFPARAGDDIARRSLAKCRQQRFYHHPFFFVSPREAQLHASINMLINALVHYSPQQETSCQGDAEGNGDDSRVTLRSDCDHAGIWLNLYEKLAAFINICLDDIGYNIFPVENLDLGLHGSNRDDEIGDLFGPQFSDAALHRHMSCGTLITLADEAVCDVSHRYLVGSLGEDARGGDGETSLSAHWRANGARWCMLNQPSSDEGGSGCGSGCGCGSSGCGCGSSVTRNKSSRPLFVNILDDESTPCKGSRQGEGSEVDKMSNLGLLLLFSKLSSLIRTSENILGGLLAVFSPIEQVLKERNRTGSVGGDGFSQPVLSRSSSADKSRKRRETDEDKVAERLAGVYESRCLLFSALMKVFCKGSGRYVHAQRTALMSARRGMEVLSCMHVAEDSSSLEMIRDGLDRRQGLGVTETLLLTSASSEAYPRVAQPGPAERDDPLFDSDISLSSSSTSYFFPYMYGKLLFQRHQEYQFLEDMSCFANPENKSHCCRASLMAVRYLYHAQSCVRRAAKGDKAEKKYRAHVEAEMQRVRLSVSMRLLMPQTPNSQISPNGQSTPEELGSPMCLLLEVLGHHLLQDGPTPPLLSSSMSSAMAATTNELARDCDDGRESPGTGIGEVGQGSVRVCSSCAGSYEGDPRRDVLHARSLLTLVGNLSGFSRSEQEGATAHLLCANLCSDCSSLAQSPAQVEQIHKECLLQSPLNAQPQTLQLLHHASIWEVIVNSIEKLLYCKIYDNFDFKSVMVLAQFVFGVSKVRSLSNPYPAASGASSESLAWATPPPEARRQLRAMGVDLTAAWCAQFLQTRMLDKKRPQIVGIWVQECSLSACEMFLKRILVYDYQRYKCINLHLEVCLASQAAPQMSDLLAWTSAAFVASRRQRCSALTAWAMRATALASVHLFSTLLATFSRAAEEAVAAASWAGEGVLAGLFDSWARGEAGSERALYTFPASVAFTSASSADNSATPLTFLDIFERLFAGVDKFLAAGNRCDLHSRLGGLLVSYYQLHASMCLQRYEELKEISNGRDRSFTDDGRRIHPTDSLALSDSVMASAGSGDMHQAPTGGEVVGQSMLLHSPVPAAPAAAPAAVSGRYREVPRPDLISGSITATSTAQDAPPQTAGITTGNGSGNNGGTVCLETVLAWCRRQTSWQTLRPTTSLRAPITASLKATSASSLSQPQACEEQEDAGDGA